jgi:hypothetical protein
MNTEWMSQFQTSAPGALAANAQFVMATVLIQEPTTPRPYPAGTMVGGKLDIHVETGLAGGGHQVEFISLVLPPGLAVPTVNLDTTLKQQENYVWHRMLLRPSPSSNSTAWERLSLTTKRNYEQGGSLVFIVVNRAGGAWVGSSTRLIADLYLVY